MVREASVHMLVRGVLVQHLHSGHVLRHFKNAKSDVRQAGSRLASIHTRTTHPLERTYWGGEEGCCDIVQTYAWCVHPPSGRQSGAREIHCAWHIAPSVLRN